MSGPIGMRVHGLNQTGGRHLSWTVSKGRGMRILLVKGQHEVDRRLLRLASRLSGAETLAHRLDRAHHLLLRVRLVGMAASRRAAVARATRKSLSLCLHLPIRSAPHTTRRVRLTVADLSVG